MRATDGAADHRKGASERGSGLRELLASRGEDVQELTLRAMVPISLLHEQSGQASGNQDGWMVVPLPLGEPDAVRRLRLIAAETAERNIWPVRGPALGSLDHSCSSECSCVALLISG